MSFGKSRGMKLLLALFGLGVFGALGAAAGIYLAFVRDLPELRTLEDYRPPLASQVYDRHGARIAEFFRERRELTPLAEVPDHVVRAFVSGEDNTFFEHSGVDFVSILRAAWKNLLAGGEKRQGGSTITQQMVKGLLLTPERTYRRKVREMILARDVERHFTKQEILYLYLNQIYFGHGAYGIGEAARTYFDKPVAELTISEGALLAGLPKAPSRYSPMVNPEKSEQRRLYVLERMHADGFLDDATYAAAREDLPILKEPAAHEGFAAASYFTEDVRRYLFERFGGEAVLEGGLRVETTLDLALQTEAVASVQAGLRALSKRQGYRGPLRRVAREALEQEIAKLAIENGLAKPATEEAAAAEEAPAPEETAATEEAPAPEKAPGAEESLEAPALALAGEGPFLGVVTAVDAEAKTARIAFGAGVEGFTRLADARWARPPNPSKAPRRMRDISKVFRVGDVAPFLLRKLSEKDGDEPGSLRVALFQEPVVQGALLSLEVASGDVIALVGGYDFAQSQFDRVTQARRQPGSSFKPFIYGAAIGKGYTPASIIFDRPVVYTDEASGFVWRPRNYGRSFYGPITLREALVRSVNNATVHLFRDVGVDYVIDYSRRLGIESPLNRDLSLALGSSGLSLLEITRAYGVFPSGGRRLQPRFITRVTDRDGNVLIEDVLLGDEGDAGEGEETAGDAALAPVAAAGDADGNGDRASNGFDAGLPEDHVISPEEAFLVSDLLRAVVKDADGTGWRLRALRRPVAGKTGTTNDQADAWFLGFSPEVVTGVWVGHDVSRFLGWGETGSRAAAPIWLQYMEAALAGRPIRDFQAPDDIVWARIDRKTGLLADGNSKNTVFQAFLVDTVPEETSRSAATQTEGRRLLRMDDF
jgi:penicillin-binding protein 1A